MDGRIDRWVEKQRDGTRIHRCRQTYTDIHPLAYIDVCVYTYVCMHACILTYMFWSTPSRQALQKASTGASFRHEQGRCATRRPFSKRARVRCLRVSSSLIRAYRGLHLERLGLTGYVWSRDGLWRGPFFFFLASALVWGPW